MFVPLFCFAAIVCFALQVYMRSRNSSSGALSSSEIESQSVDEFFSNRQSVGVFNRFKWNWLTVYYIVMGGDWLMGPYLYALYNHYGYSNGVIATFYLTGFVSSMIFGTFVGSIADKYGRKRGCLLFALLYIAANLSKLNNDKSILYLGHFFSGIGTSLLHSSFESWLVSEHNERRFSSSQLSDTFSLATFGNGLIAIAAGLVASFATSIFGLSGPFLCSAFLLAVAFIAVLLMWGENYGDSSANVQQTLSNAVAEMRNDIRIPLLGLVQSLFEASMYTFVFMWSPAYNAVDRDNDVPYGVIFSLFMVMIMIGSTVFSMMMSGRAWYYLYTIGFVVFVTSSISFAIATAIPDSYLSLTFAFCLFELCCGIYFPCIASLRGRHIPEHTRSTLMNFFRVPLNILVVFALINVDNYETSTMFLMCSGWLMIAFVILRYIRSITPAVEDNNNNNSSSSSNSNSSNSGNNNNNNNKPIEMTNMAEQDH